jgi:uncharacterized membrane protein
MAKTNLATVKDWPWIVTAMDLFWGGNRVLHESRALN